VSHEAAPPTAAHPPVRLCAEPRSTRAALSCLPRDVRAWMPAYLARRRDQSLFARDRHLNLRPEAFLAAVSRVAQLLPPGRPDAGALGEEAAAGAEGGAGAGGADAGLEGAYAEAREANRVHAYVMPYGLVYGPLGVKDVDVFVKKGQASEVLRWDDSGEGGGDGADAGSGAL
jgi:hypothetical protein